MPPRATRGGGAWPWRIVVAAVVFVTAAARTGAEAASPQPKPDTDTPRRVYSIEDSPGFYRKPDPDSASVRIGRRRDAPRVSMPFQGGAGCLDQLGRAVCRALHHGDVDSLRALCVGMDEFRDIMWREFPQSRPATGLTWEDAWRVLDVRLIGGCNGAVRENAGHALEFLRWERVDTAAVYKNFRLHNGLILVAQTDDGGIARFGWLRSVAERRGRFKIYSMRD